MATVRSVACLVYGYIPAGELAYTHQARCCP